MCRLYSFGQNALAPISMSMSVWLCKFLSMFVFVLGIISIEKERQQQCVMRPFVINSLRKEVGYRLVYTTSTWHVFEMQTSCLLFARL
jgi:hypothetical protein